MGFLDLSIEKSSLITQKNDLEYQELILGQQENDITQQLSDYLSQDGATEDAFSKSLEADQQIADSKKATIDSQLKLINQEITDYDKAVDTNIKECKLSVSV